VGGGAWPFLVGGAICLVNSDNERDSSLLNRLFSFIAASPGALLARAACSAVVTLTVLLRGTGGGSAARNRAITGL
jgi:hypothetical protein